MGDFLQWATMNNQVVGAGPFPFHQSIKKKNSNMTRDFFVSEASKNSRYLPTQHNKALASAIILYYHGSGSSSVGGR